MCSITFEESAKEIILSWFDKKVDDEGFIIEKSTRKRVTASNGSEIRVAEFSGIDKEGILIRSDLPSLIDYMENNNEKI